MTTTKNNPDSWVLHFDICQNWDPDERARPISFNHNPNCEFQRVFVVRHFESPFSQQMRNFGQQKMFFQKAQISKIYNG